MKSQRKILITGGAGFIGSQLGYRLHSQDCQVILLDNLMFGHIDNLSIDGQFFGQFVAKDIRDAHLQPLFDGVDTVFHFAGIAALPVCQSQPGLAYDINVAGTANILEYARRAKVRRVIFSSTSAVYEGGGHQLHREDESLSPNLIYAMTKLACEEMCDGFAQNYGMDIIIPRFFNVYGPHQDFKRKSPPFTSYLARELTQGRTPILFNKSDAKRDYVHSEDLIALLLKMLDAEEKFAAERFNVGSGVGYSVPQLCEIMQKVSGRTVCPEYKDPESYWNAYGDLYEGYSLSRERVKKEVYKDCVADNAKTCRTFGWCPAISVEAGFKTVYEYALARCGV